MIKIYVSRVLDSKTIELFNFLDDKDIPYEIKEANTEWVFLNKIKSLPVVEIDGEILSMKKIMKRLKKYKG